MHSTFIFSLILAPIIIFIALRLALYLLDPHNLRRFPSPRPLSALTNIGYIILRLHGNRSERLHALHKQHPIIRLGPTSLSLSTPGAIRAIYGHSTPCVKGDMYSLQQGTHASLLDTVSKENHARKRRMLSHAFATRNLEGWEEKVADKTARLVKQFDKICESAATSCEGGFAEVDFRKWSNLFTIEAIADIALSRRLGCLERGDDSVMILGGREYQEERVGRYIEYLHANRRFSSRVVWSGTVYWLAQVVSRMLFWSTWRKMRFFDEMVKHFTMERVQQHQKGMVMQDFVTSLLQDKTGELRELELEEVIAEVGVFLDAGSDTTAIAITHVMYHLLRNPEEYVRLREELEDALEKPGTVAPYGIVKTLPFLRACLDESLRLSPPVSFGIHRKTPPEGFHIDGQWIPGGITVGVPAYTAHRNEDYFPDPEKYRPARWLGDGAKAAQASFIPFSTGARGCIGRNISYIEQSILLATLIRLYDFELLYPERKLEHEEGFNLWPLSLPLKIRRRIASS